MIFHESIEIEKNKRLRNPQREGWRAIQLYYESKEKNNNVSIVLPVGCGKSGLIAITPYAVNARRVLIIAPGTKIRDQLVENIKSNSAANFYEKCSVLPLTAQFPEVVVVASNKVNHDDLQHADIVISNIQQIAGEENRWLDTLGEDFFDLIIVDEGHHNIAASWQQVFKRFPNARIINFSATPTRSDGQLMEGRVIYSFPVIQAIKEGYVKELTAKMLSPAELSYVDRINGERTISLQEVIELGQSDSEFRRGIVMSESTLSSLVDYSIEELRKLQNTTGEKKLKIIASALNIDHCIQITEAFRARGLRADYVHSTEGQERNRKIFQQLENHDLEVIVQARMLGEGFDHKYLAVAMVGSIFSNLAPFVQYVGRIMRVVKENSPGDILNRGVVVFHAGANIAQRWNDFRNFSSSDQEYFESLLPEAESVNFDHGDVFERTSASTRYLAPVEILSEVDVSATDMQPIIDDLLHSLVNLGVTPEQAAKKIRKLRPTRQDTRCARQLALDEKIKNEAGKLIKQFDINPGGRQLDRRKLKTNYPWLVAELNRRVNNRVSEKKSNRSSFTLEQLNIAHDFLMDCIASFSEELKALLAEESTNE